MANQLYAYLIPPAGYRLHLTVRVLLATVRHSLRHGIKRVRCGNLDGSLNCIRQG